MLEGRPKLLSWYLFQDAQRAVEARSDTDRAGCRRAMINTTSGFASFCTHLIELWCETQAIVALSSAEAELYSLARVSRRRRLGRFPSRGISGWRRR